MAKLFHWGDNLPCLNAGTLYPPHTIGVYGTGTTWTKLGNNISCVQIVDSSTNLWTYGIYVDNGQGDAYNNVGAGKLIPTKIVESISGWTTLSTNGRSAVGVMSNGNAYGWCYENTNYKLGDLTNTPRYHPVQITNGKTWKQINSGQYSSIGITTDGKLWGWGDNQSSSMFKYTIGYTGAVDIKNMIQLGTDTDWNYVTQGLTGGFAIKTNGTLHKLGLFGGTQVNGTLQVGTDSDWLSISQSIQTDWVVALKTDGTVWTWGDNSLGQLGFGDITLRSTPTQLTGLTNIIKVHASSTRYNGYAISSTGKLYAWGNSSYYMNSNGINTNTRIVPTEIGISGVKYIDVSSSDTYAYALGETPPDVLTSGATSITTTTAIGNGNVVSIGTGTFIERGFCWSTSANPTTGNTHATVAGTIGTFNYTITGLIQNTTYHYRAYAVNSVGISYGADMTFTTVIPPKYFQLTKTDITCHNANDGTITAINASGGTAPYTWSKNGITYQTGTTFTGLSANTYTIYMKDASGTTLTHTATINNATLIYGEVSYTYPSCSDGDGTITFINQSGGTQPYQYSIDYVVVGTWQSSPNFTGLSSNWSYKCAMRDANGCIVMIHNGLFFPEEHVLDAGTIGNQQSVEIGTIPQLLTTLTQPDFGIAGTGYTQQWQYTTDGIFWYDILGATGDTYQPTAALVDTMYHKVVSTLCNFKLTPRILINILSPFPPPFCDGTNYELIQPSTCGNADAIMWIENLDYFKYFNFLLTDEFGGQHYFNQLTGECTGLTAGWYFLTVSAYPAYWYVYGSDTCHIDWLPIIDIDTLMSVNSVKIRPAQCQPFDRQAGRIYYKIDGFDTGHTYSLYAWKTSAQPYYGDTPYYQLTGITSNNQVQIPKAAPDCYYGILVDDTTDCHLLLDAECVNTEEPFSLGGIKKLWIAPWSTDIEYNYWDSADDDYFLEFEDTSFFTSTKITEFYSHTGGTIQWYSLPIAPQVVKLSQKLNKVRQGFIFEDAMDIAISAADAFKWQEIQPIVNIDNKWIIVCIDDNDYAWVSGYRHGARITAFKNQSGDRDGENGYTLSFTSQSENKILTAIDKAYITNHII